MNVYIITDLEGVAGVVSWNQTEGESPAYEEAKKLLTGEVNAAIEGLLECGVKDIIVGDWHGIGGLTYTDLHPSAKLMHGRPWGTYAARDAATAHCDVFIIIGQHAMAGTIDGNLNHTQCSVTIEYYKLNGQPVGEIAQFALYQGSLNRPLIYLSGDEAACREAEALVPGIVTTAVKKGLGRQCALCLSPAESRRKIREDVKKAIANHRAKPIAPVTLPAPWTLEKKFTASQYADSECNDPNFQRIDSTTVRIQLKDIKEALWR